MFLSILFSAVWFLAEALFWKVEGLWFLAGGEVSPLTEPFFELGWPVSTFENDIFF
jgi:hypothetical protein